MNTVVRDAPFATSSGGLRSSSEGGGRVAEGVSLRDGVGAALARVRGERVTRGGDVLTLFDISSSGYLLQSFHQFQEGKRTK